MAIATFPLRFLPGPNSALMDMRGSHVATRANISLSQSQRVLLPDDGGRATELCTGKYRPSITTSCIGVCHIASWLFRVLVVVGIAHKSGIGCFRRCSVRLERNVHGAIGRYKDVQRFRSGITGVRWCMNEMEIRRSMCSPI